MKIQLVLAAVGVGGMALACGSSNPSGSVGVLTGSSVLGLSLSSYDPAKAAAFADGHWDDGIGLCAQFVSDSLIAGGAGIADYAWVPDLLEALQSGGVAYDEYNSSNTTVGGSVGDVAIFSDAAGTSFCITASTDENNCGHAGIVVVAGGSINTIEADFHNNAHEHMPIGYILGSGYTTLRVYHVAKAAQQAQQTHATPAVDAGSSQDSSGGAMDAGMSGDSASGDDGGGGDSATGDDGGATDGGVEDGGGYDGGVEDGGGGGDGGVEDAW
jgi:hypothetical protein